VKKITLVFMILAAILLTFGQLYADQAYNSLAGGYDHGSYHLGEFLAMSRQERTTNTWTGALGTNWHANLNWSLHHFPRVDEDVVIPVTGNGNYPVLADTAFCNILSLDNGASLTVTDGHLTVSGDVANAGHVALTTGSSYVTIEGTLMFLGGSTAEQVMNSRFFIHGDLEFYAGNNVNIDEGFMEFAGTGNSFIRTAGTAAIGDLEVNKTDGTGFVSISNLSSETLKMNSAISVGSGNTLYHPYTGNTELGGTLIVYSGGNLYFDEGILYLSPRDLLGVWFLYDYGTGNYLNNLTVDTDQGQVSLSTDFTIAGSLTLISGAMLANDNTLYVGRNWYKQSTADVFRQDTGRVVLNGNSFQEIQTEDFNILELAKASGVAYVMTGQTVTCMSYDWTSGELAITGGAFTAHDLADPGIFGSINLTGGSLDFWQDTDPGSYVDMNADLRISGGSLTVHGGSDDSFFAYGCPASLEMSGGMLDFPNQSIIISTANAFADSLTGGIIRTGESFVDFRGDFTPYGGTIILNGSADCSLVCAAGSHFHNVQINKTIPTDQATEDASYRELDHASPAERVPRTCNVDIGTCFIRGGLFVVDANYVFLAGNVACTDGASVSVGSAIFNLNGFNLACTGNLELNAGGVLSIDPGSSLKMAGGSLITVNDGGILAGAGTSGSGAMITHISSGYYGIYVYSGGILSASYTVFEYMGINGIALMPESQVDPANALSNCVFRNGITNGKLLVINNGQSFTVTGAIFPANTWSGACNVSKGIDAGDVYFAGWSGDFGGSSYELDAYNRIWWEGSGIPPIRDLNIQYVEATDRVRLDWVYPFGATSYNIYSRSDPYGVFTFRNSTTNLYWSDLIPGEHRFYKVTAVME
jgi:hypothetical protein